MISLMGSASLRAPGVRANPVAATGEDREACAAGAAPESGPTLLLIGARGGFEAALKESLERHGVAVGTAPAADVLRATRALAPDLVLLVDDAAQALGRGVIEQLQQSPQTSPTPVVILDDAPGLTKRLEAFRHGATAVVRRSASVDAIASEVATLARDIPSRPNRGLGALGEVTLEELVATLAEELRSGILSVRSKGAPEGGAVRLVLGSGRPVSDIIAEFVSKMGSHVLKAEPLEYEFDERAEGTVQLLAAGGGELSGAGEITGLRILLADDDTARADCVAQELRRLGAVVAVTDLAPTEARLARLRELDPGVLLLGEAHLQGPGYRLVWRMRQDLRLRWPALCVVDWDKVWPDVQTVPDLTPLRAALVRMSEVERLLRFRIGEEAGFDVRLETIGPARLLRAVGEVGHPVRLTVFNPRATVRVDLAAGIVVGAVAEILAAPRRTLEGPLALAALLVLGSGRVTIERCDQPATTNLMATPDVALELASQEPLPITPSMPAPSPRDETEGKGARTGWRRGVVIGTAGAVVLVAVLLASALLQRPKESSPAPVVPLASLATPPLLPHDRVSGPARAAAPAASRTEAPGPRVDPCAGALEKYQRAGVGVELVNARRALVKGELDLARDWFCVGAGRYPKEVQAWSGLIRTLLLAQDLGGALFSAERAVQEKPRDSLLRALLGDAHVRLGHLEQAELAWAQAAEVNLADDEDRSELLERYLSSGNSALDERRYADACRFFRRVTTLAPQRVDAVVGLARCLLGDRDLAGALVHARHAVELDPNHAGAHVALGDALLRDGDRSGAIREWSRALELVPRNPEARQRLERAARR